MRPGFRKGARPVNVGRRWPAEVLSPGEVQALMAATHRNVAHDKRERAVVWLMYRVAVKLVECLAMQPSDYIYGSNKLTIPATGRLPERTVNIDAVTRGYLDEWIEQRRALGFGPTVAMFCSVGHPSGRPVKPNALSRAITARAKRAGIEKRVTPEGLRKSGREHGVARTFSVEGQIEAYVDEAVFGSRYPDAYRKWRDALDLYAVNPERHATRIGHDCREALADFARALARHHGVKLTSRPEQTIAALRTVIASKGTTSPRVAAQLDALVAYFGTVSDLGQRQEHGASKEGEPLTADDARRVVFYAMLVMYEIDRTLSRIDG